MDNENYITSDSLSGDAGTTASDGGEAVKSSVTLDQLNQLLGKEFKDVDTALKSVKDTYGYVGKVGQLEKQVVELSKDNSNKIAQEAEIVKTVKQLKNDAFFKDNSQYAPYRKAIEKLGDDPSDIVSQPEFKEVFEKAMEADKAQSLKSVLESNPRLQVSGDLMSQAREASNTGNSREATTLATKAVMEAFDIK